MYVRSFPIFLLHHVLLVGYDHHTLHDISTLTNSICSTGVFRNTSSNPCAEVKLHSRLTRLLKNLSFSSFNIYYCLDSVSLQDLFCKTPHSFVSHLYFFVLSFNSVTEPPFIHIRRSNIPFLGLELQVKLRTKIRSRHTGMEFVQRIGDPRRPKRGYCTFIQNEYL